jgi:hypothetical protein
MVALRRDSGMIGRSATAGINHDPSSTPYR